MSDPQQPTGAATPQGRTVAESEVVMGQLMLPGDANPAGNVHGGIIMKLVDTTAGVAATRHARARTVTARIDSMSFLQPVYVGELVTLKAAVNDVGRTSLEVGVRVETEDLITGAIRHVSSAYLVFVALDEHGRPTAVPPLIAETEQEKRRMAEAKLRRAHRQSGEENVRAMRSQGIADSGLSALATWKKPHAAFAVIGHRGAAGLAPENTLPSLELARTLGADAVEIDLHLSRDGVPVVIHDATVDRTTDGRGAVADLSVAELQALDARGPFQSHPRAQIPTLEEVLTWARGKTRLVIELKGTDNPDLVPKALALIREYRMIDQSFLISFDHLALRAVRATCPEVRTGALYVARAADPVAIAATCGADAICPQWTGVTAKTIAAVRQAGCAVSIWTVNQVEDLHRVRRLGVDAVTTDYPDRACAIAQAEGR